MHPNLHHAIALSLMQEENIHSISFDMVAGNPNSDPNIHCIFKL